MRIAVVGAGGVGGYFGARLAQGGHDVVFIARGAHLAAMRAGGLRVESPLGDIQLSPVSATDDPVGVGKVELVLVAVKDWQLEEALGAIRPLVGPETAVLPLLNGVEAADRLAEALEGDRVVAGLCGIVARIEAPGHVVHAGGKTFIRLGERDNLLTPRVERIRDSFATAEVEADIAPDIDEALWQKLLFIAPTSGVGAAAGATFGMMRTLPELRRLVDRAMRETRSVGQALGVALGDTHLRTALGLLEAAPVESTTSMARDVQAGRPSELEAQTGAVVRLAARSGTPVPVNEVLYACLLPRERRARGEL